MNRVSQSLFVSLALHLVVAGAAAAGPPPPVEPGDLLASTGLVGGSLIAVDPATGAGQFRFNLGGFGPVTEIEFRADGTLFGSTGEGSRNIITIDPDTGVETLVGQHAPSAVNGLEFVGDVLYGALLAGGQGGEGLGSRLVVVDQTDGSLADVGDIGFIPVRGLAYDEEGGVLYGVASPPPPQVADGNGPGGDVLITVDLATGAGTLVGATGFSIVGALEFGPDGTLYGGVGQSGPPGAQEGPPSGSLITIDPASGVGTLVGASGFPALSGLSFVPGGGPSVLEIPTLSWLGLALLAALLAAAAVVALRRL